MKIERINDWFARQGRWMVQKRWLVLSLFILVFAIGFTGLRYFKVSASWENYFLKINMIYLSATCVHVLQI